MPEVAEWKFERGGWLQVYQLKERAGAGAVKDPDGSSIAFAEAVDLSIAH